MISPFDLFISTTNEIDEIKLRDFKRTHFSVWILCQKVRDNAISFIRFPTLSLLYRTLHAYKTQLSFAIDFFSNTIEKSPEQKREGKKNVLSYIKTNIIIKQNYV